MITAEIGANRFGLGAYKRVDLANDPRKTLKSQLHAFIASPPIISAAPASDTIARLTSDHLDELRMQGVIGDLAVDDSALTERQKRKRAADTSKAVRKFLGRSARDFYRKSLDARIENAVTTQTSFPERLVHFWSNHFAVSVEKPLILGFAGVHEFEAIRPNIMGHFSDLLKAAVLHPAMLLYLDQAQSIGPDSMIGNLAKRRKGRRTFGLNENLAREILELHTLGVNGGYSQSDVVALANALTGWTVTGLNRGTIGRFLKLGQSYGKAAFANELHQPGSTRLLGRKYGSAGKQQSLDILDDLAKHPATAAFVAGKLAQHFYGDDAPASLTGRLRDDFIRTGGDLTSLYEVLIDSPELWVKPATKFKSPWEWAISIMRAFPDTTPVGKRPVNALRVMNHMPWRPGSPAGFGDRNSDWISPDGLFKRVQYANQIAARLRDIVAVDELARQLLPSSLGQSTLQELKRAESPQQALALLLISPEFLRR